MIYIEGKNHKREPQLTADLSHRIVMSKPLSTLQDDYSIESLDTAISRTIEQLSKEQEGDDSTREILSEFQKAIFNKQRRGEFNSVSLSRFSFHAINKRPTLFTGYYQPRLKGSLRETAKARFPVYGYNETTLTREEIDGKGSLKNRGLEIAWVSDAVELFFMHIQGSGIIELEDGSTQHLAFAGHNNQPYYAIGKHVAEKGAINVRDISAQKIKAYLRAHPHESSAILNLNPRYIFFKLLDDGPIGTLKTALVPMRSIACDWDFYPPGALCYVELQIPTFDSLGVYAGQRPASFFTINHDTGSAIRGASRVDLFCGGGEEAERIAGHLNHHGSVYLLRC